MDVFMFHKRSVYYGAMDCKSVLIQVMAWRRVDDISLSELVMTWILLTAHHEDVIDFPRYWPFVRAIHRSSVNSPHKNQWRRALVLSLISAWINDWVNNHEPGDLRRHRSRYDVTVIRSYWVTVTLWKYCICIEFDEQSDYILLRTRYANIDAYYRKFLPDIFQFQRGVKFNTLPSPSTPLILRSSELLITLDGLGNNKYRFICTQWFHELSESNVIKPEISD